MYGGRAPKEEWRNKVCMYVCMYLRKFSNHVTYTDRRPDCPSAPQAYQCKIIQSTGMATKLQLKVLFG